MVSGYRDCEGIVNLFHGGFYLNSEAHIKYTLKTYLSGVLEFVPVIQMLLLVEQDQIFNSLLLNSYHALI